MTRLHDWNATATIPAPFKEHLPARTLPPNLADGNLEDFVHALLYYGPSWWERSYCIPIDKDSWTRTWRVFPYNDGSGYLVRSQWQSKAGEQGGYVAEVKTYAMCDHELTETVVGNCYRRYSCAKCGLQFHIDSSD